MCAAELFTASAIVGVLSKLLGKQSKNKGVGG
jgi:hypothetical protein